MKSLKISAISGLVAGFVAGIVAIIFQNIVLIYGLTYALMPYNLPKNVILVYIIMNIIWGVIFGIIYSKTYRLIPGDGISKGLIYGLLVLLITNIRDGSYYLPYGPDLIPGTISWFIIGFFMWLSYGLLLGILYDELMFSGRYPVKEKKIKTYDMSSGIHAGAIAGLAGGLVAFPSRVLGVIIGLFPLAFIQVDLTIFMALFGQQILLNMIWGIVFGVIYTKVYNIVPGKGIIKGLYYGLIFFLIASFRTMFYYIGWGDMDLAGHWGWVGFFQAIAFGFVLGLLYRKPTK